MDARKLRSWWAALQALDSSLSNPTPPAILDRAGWARSVGGANPYLTLFSRGAISKSAAEAAASALQILELPSARGCTYFLPSSDIPLALTLAHHAAGDTEMRQARKIGVTDSEIDTLQSQIRSALQSGPLDPDALRAACPAVRPLGDPGKKIGLSTTLPLALGPLQTTGRIRRLPLHSRLDTQRFSYTLWPDCPLHASPLSLDHAATLLAQRYFAWTAPATLAEFQWFSGFSAKTAKAAIAPLNLIPFPDDPTRLLSPAQLDAYNAFTTPAKPHYSLLSALDSAVLLRRNIPSLLHDANAPAVQSLRGLSDLASNPILDRGEIVGLWEFDTSSQSIVTQTFSPATKTLQPVIAALQSHIRELGDARSFSLDTPKSRAARIAALQKGSPQ